MHKSHNEGVAKKNKKIKKAALALNGLDEIQIIHRNVWTGINVCAKLQVYFQKHARGNRLHSTYDPNNALLK